MWRGEEERRGRWHACSERDGASLGGAVEVAAVDPAEVVLVVEVVRHRGGVQVEVGVARRLGLVGARLNGRQAHLTRGGRAGGQERVRG